VAGDAANVLTNKSGLISRAANAFTSLSPQAQAATITGGTQLIGGVMQGVGMQKAQNDQAKQTAQQKADWNTNVGTRLYA
jgi:hypothetical protein